MFGFYATIFVGGSVLVLAIIAIGLKLQAHRMRNRKEMEDLVLGRSSSRVGRARYGLNHLPEITQRPGSTASDSMISKSRSRASGPCTLQIDYVDADGVWTTRRIAPYKSGNTNDRFDAWCETRQERRTFLFARVQSGYDLLTGQRLDRAGVFRHVHPERRVPSELR